MKFKINNINIRLETPSDYNHTELVIKSAFKNTEHTDYDEHKLVNRLRKSNCFIPELALVAEYEGKIIGYILFTKVLLPGKQKTDSLALAPIAVCPLFQNEGVGKKLINTGLLKAKALGFESVIVLGHKDYYPQFGFKKASNWNITCPLDVPDEAFMALELKKNALKGNASIVQYAEEFRID